MLVLTRRAKHKIVFPTLGVTVHVLGIENGQVRLGIEAPPDIPILRGELAELEAAGAGYDTDTLMNRIDKVARALKRLRRHVEAGREDEALATLGQAFPAMEALEQELSRRRADQSAASTKNRRAPIAEDGNDRGKLLSGLNPSRLWEAIQNEIAQSHAAN